MHSQVAQVFDCIRHDHDPWLVLLAGLVCLCGIYASFALAAHAVRSGRKTRRLWGPVSIVSAGCTAWATHFIILLAFEPGMPSAFDPLLTAVSLLCAIGGIGAGTLLALKERRQNRRFAAGLVIGIGIALLHYVGQEAYLVEGVERAHLRLRAKALALVANRDNRLLLAPDADLRSECPDGYGIPGLSHQINLPFFPLREGFKIEAG